MIIFQKRGLLRHPPEARLLPLDPSGHDRLRKRQLQQDRHRLRRPSHSKTSAKVRPKRTCNRVTRNTAVVSSYVFKLIVFCPCLLWQVRGVYAELDARGLSGVHEASHRPAPLFPAGVRSVAVRPQNQEMDRGTGNWTVRGMKFSTVRPWSNLRIQRPASYLKSVQNWRHCQIIKPACKPSQELKHCPGITR